MRFLLFFSIRYRLTYSHRKDWVGYGFTNYVTGSIQWRIPVVLQSVFIVIILGLCFVVPESPRWDLSHGNNERALETLSRLNARSSDDPIVLEQYQAIEQAVQLEKSVGSGKWSELLSFKDDEIKSKRRLFIACFLQAAQQLGGINGIVSVRWLPRCDPADSVSSLPPDLLCRNATQDDWAQRPRLLFGCWIPFHLVLRRFVHSLVLD